MIVPVRLTVTIAALRRHSACELPARLAELEVHLGYLPADDAPLSLLGVWMVLSSTSTADAIWALRAAGPAADARYVAVTVAVRAARRVEHLLPIKGRAACVAAIEAAEAWLAESTPSRAATVARAAAWAAADAATVARTAAWAAAAAVDAARSSALAAADAAEAAFASAWAASADTADTAAWADAARDAARSAASAAAADAAATTKADLTALLAA